MEVLYALEALRTPLLDRIMSLVTLLGGETVFLVIALFFFWCVDKNRGYYLMSVGFAGTILNQFLKILCRIPRPWVLDPSFTIVESARSGATGYSFPSGHTQNAVGTFGVIGSTARRRWVKVLSYTLAVLIPFSRMYLGVHTPLDVGVSCIAAVALILLLRPVFYGRRSGEGQLYLLFALMAAVGLAFVLYLELYPFPADVDPENYRSAVENGYTLLGAVLGVNAAHYVDCRFLRFDTKAPPAGQACKLALGLVVVVLVMEGLKGPLGALFGGHAAADALRYFLVVVMAGCLWPMTFPFFQRLGGR